MRRDAWATVLVAVAACDGEPARALPPPAVLPDAGLAVSEDADAVWVTSSLAKVGPRERPPRDPSLIAELQAARNETESFQIHVHAGNEGRKQVSIALPADSADSKWRASRVSYMNIGAPSAPWGKGGPAPDALVPARDETFDEARSAFPVDVPAHTTLSIWVDVFVPQDARPGRHSDRIVLKDEAGTIAATRADVLVHHFTLPSTASLASAFFMSPLGPCLQAYGSYEACGAWPGARGNPDRGVELSHVAVARFLLDRRITMANVVYAGSEREGFTHVDATYGALLAGSDQTRLRGARLTSLELVGVPERDLLARWYEHARARGYADRLFYYRCDEPPRGCSLSDAQREGQLVHSAARGLRWLVTGDGARMTHEPMARDVNVLAANMALLPAPGAPQRAAYDAFATRPGGALFWYQDCSQFGCGRVRVSDAPVASYVVDASGVQNRVSQWLAFLYGVRGELYHGIDDCWSHACASVQGETRDPWEGVLAHGGWGDGTLFYPGVPARVGGMAPTFVSSMRLEHIRDGMEDYEYLRLLAARDPAEATRIARTFARSTSDFEARPEALLAAREALARAIENAPATPAAR